MKERSNATVLCVHHMSKSAGGKGDKFDLEAWLDQGAMRGASGLTGAARWQMNVVTLPDKQAAKYGYAGDSQVIALKVCKKNYGPPEDTFFFQRGRGGVLSRFEATKSGEEISIEAAIIEKVVAYVREREEKGEPRITARTLARGMASAWRDEIPGCSAASIISAIDVGTLLGNIQIVVEKNESGRPTEYLKTEAQRSAREARTANREEAREEGLALRASYSWADSEKREEFLALLPSRGSGALQPCELQSARTPPPKGGEAFHALLPFGVDPGPEEEESTMEENQNPDAALEPKTEPDDWEDF